MSWLWPAVVLASEAMTCSEPKSVKPHLYFMRIQPEAIQLLDQTGSGSGFCNRLQHPPSTEMVAKQA